MLFTVAVTFLLSAVPEAIVYVLTDLEKDQGTQKYLDLWTAAWAYQLLYDLYHASNFVIYMIFLKQFRNCFLGCFRRSQLGSQTSSRATGSDVISVSKERREN